MAVTGHDDDLGETTGFDLRHGERWAVVGGYAEQAWVWLGASIASIFAI